MSTKSDRLIDILRLKYSEDPDSFRRFLPGAAELLPEPLPSKGSSRSPYGLTEHERSYHKAGLAGALSKVEVNEITVEDAIKGLQHCADLIKDDVFTDAVSYEPAKALLRAALGKSPGSYKSKTTVSVCEDGGSPVEQISVIKGVYLDLDTNGQLVSVSINPREVRERKKLMGIIGIGKDTQADVALRHDDYLAMQDPHGRW